MILHNIFLIHNVRDDDAKMLVRFKCTHTHTIYYVNKEKSLNIKAKVRERAMRRSLYCIESQQINFRAS